MQIDQINRPRPAPGLEGVKAYGIPEVPGFVDLHLDGNEGAVPPCELLDSLSRLGSDLMRRYPDARPLEEQLAVKLGLDPSRVLVTAGGDAALLHSRRHGDRLEGGSGRVGSQQGPVQEGQAFIVG